MNFNAKTIARLAAVQAIYALMSNSDMVADDALDKIISYYRDNKAVAEDYEQPLESKIKPSESHLRTLVEWYASNKTEIDALINQHLIEGNSLDDMNHVLLALLRAGVTELKYFPEVPFKVVINEYTNIASMLLKEEDVPFVNATLDFVYKLLAPK